MMTDYREMMDMPKLCNATGILRENLNERQKKAIKNIKYCAEDQWQYVNSWYDEKSESAREYMMNAQELFDTIYYESQKSIYCEGSVHFGAQCESFLKDIRFCGTKFLKQVCFYYTAKLLEDSVCEVEGTEEDAKRVYKDLLEIKEHIDLLK